jgi:DNA (cytosine-5)-methyltransferase 1
MRSWKRYSVWLANLRTLGYHVREQVLNAADFGVPQGRRRLFVMCDLNRQPGSVQPRVRQKKSAATVLSATDKFSFSPLYAAGRAVPTLERAERAIACLGNNKPFLLVYYGSDAAGGWQRLDVPLRTITTLDRFALVRPTSYGHEMRMLQVPELKKAMGFPPSYRLEYGTRRDKIRLLGNAVSPPVMAAVIRTLTRD